MRPHETVLETRALVATTAMALVVLSAGPAHAEPAPPTPGPGTTVEALDPGRTGSLPVVMRPTDAPPIEVQATANRMVNGDGRTSGKCIDTTKDHQRGPQLDLRSLQQGQPALPRPGRLTLRHDLGAAGRTLSPVGGPAVGACPPGAS